MKKQVFYGIGLTRPAMQLTLNKYCGQVFKCGQFNFGWDSTNKYCIELSTGYSVCNDRNLKESISFIIEKYDFISERLTEKLVNQFTKLLKDNVCFQPEPKQVIYTVKSFHKKG